METVILCCQYRCGYISPEPRTWSCAPCAAPSPEFRPFGTFRLGRTSLMLRLGRRRYSRSYESGDLTVQIEESDVSGWPTLIGPVRTYLRTVRLWRAFFGCKRSCCFSCETYCFVFGLKYITFVILDVTLSFLLHNRLELVIHVARDLDATWLEALEPQQIYFSYVRILLASMRCWLVGYKFIHSAPCFYVC